MAIRDRMQTLNLWRVSLAGATAIILTAILALAVAPYLRMGKRDAEVDAPPIASASQLASADVDALVNRLNGESVPRTVIVFPGETAEALTGRVHHEVVPLTLDDNLAPAAIQAVLGAMLPHSGLVDVVIASAQVGNAALKVRIALERLLYRIYRPGGTGTETFGALERAQFIVGPQDATLEPIGAIFTNGVELVAAGVVDVLKPGEPVRLVLDWRITESVEDPLEVFVHLTSDEGLLIAQRDAAPGNGLFPVERWKPGEVVREQFALQLPAELPVGWYELQVGIYGSTRGYRYGLVDPEGSTYVVIQRFTIEH